jgi:hypothetical protein
MAKVLVKRRNAVMTVLQQIQDKLSVECPTRQS